MFEVKTKCIYCGEETKDGELVCSQCWNNLEQETQALNIDADGPY